MAARSRQPIAIVKENYGAWPNTYRLRNSALEVVVVTDVGSRIIALRLVGGENLFHVRPQELGGHDEPVWRLRGGWRLWTAPEGRVTTYAIRRLILWSYTRLEDPRYRMTDRLVEVGPTSATLSAADASEDAATASSGGGAIEGVAYRRPDESKIAVDSAQGWAAYLWGGTLYVKRFPHEAGAPYPDGGATIEVYSSREFLELENLGPLATLQPGAHVEVTEEWAVHPNVEVPQRRDAFAVLDALTPYIR